MSSNNQTNNQQSIHWRWQQEQQNEDHESNDNQQSIYWRWQQDTEIEQEQQEQDSY